MLSVKLKNGTRTSTGMGLAQLNMPTHIKVTRFHLKVRSNKLSVELLKKDIMEMVIHHNV